MTFIVLSGQLNITLLLVYDTNLRRAMSSYFGVEKHTTIDLITSDVTENGS